MDSVFVNFTLLPVIYSKSVAGSMQIKSCGFYNNAQSIKALNTSEIGIQGCHFQNKLENQARLPQANIELSEVNKFFLVYSILNGSNIPNPYFIGASNSTLYFQYNTVEFINGTDSLVRVESSARGAVFQDNMFRNIFYTECGGVLHIESAGYLLINRNTFIKI